MARTVTITWCEPETDDPYTVRCTVTAGYPGRGPSMADSGGEPPEPPEVDIITVTDEKGEHREDVAALLESDFYEDIYEAALMEAEEVESYEREEAWERHQEARRERRSDLDRVMNSIFGGRP